MIIINMRKEINVESQENAEEGLGKNAAIFAATFAAGKGIGSAAKKLKNDSQNRKNFKEDQREKEVRDYYETPEGRQKLRELREKARTEAKELNAYLAMSRRSVEGFGSSSLILAEEGLFSKVFSKDKERRASLKNAKYLEEFEDQKEALIATTSKKIGELEGEIERLNTFMKDDDKKCFTAIIKMHSSLLSVLNKQIEKLEAVQFETKDSIDELNEIFDKFDKDEKYEETMKLIKNEYPKSYERAKRICSMSESTFKKELKKHKTINELTTNSDDEDAMESLINGVMDDLIAEEGIVSIIQTKIEISNAVRDTNTFNKAKNKLIDEKKKMLKNIDKFTKRVSKYKSDYNKQCFNDLVKLMWDLRKVISEELKKLDALIIQDNDAVKAITELKKIEAEYLRESSNTMKKIHMLEGKYPDTVKLANKIADFENYWSSESSFNDDMEELIEEERGLIIGKESVFNIGIAKITNTDYRDIYYAILSKDYNKSKRMLSQFFSGKKTYEIPNYILRNIIEIKNQYFPVIGRATNDALDTYERTKPLLNKERSFIYKNPEAERDAKVVQRFQANIDLLKRRKESYHLDTLDDFISSKTGNYEDHRYDDEITKVDANYLKSLLQIDETLKILMKLRDINKQLPDLEEYTVLAKYSKEIAKYTNLEVFDSDDVKAPIHAYYNYITEFTMFMQFIEKSLISYVAAIYEVLNYTSIK